MNKFKKTCLAIFLHFLLSLLPLSATLVLPKYIPTSLSSQGKNRLISDFIVLFLFYVSSVAYVSITTFPQVYTLFFAILTYGPSSPSNPSSQPLKSHSLNSNSTSSSVSNILDILSLPDKYFNLIYFYACFIVILSGTDVGFSLGLMYVEYMDYVVCFCCLVKFYCVFQEVREEVSELRDVEKGFSVKHETVDYKVKVECMKTVAIDTGVKYGRINEEKYNDRCSYYLIY